MVINSSVEKIISEWLNYYIKFHNYASISIGITNKNEVFTRTFGRYLKENVTQELNPKYNIASLTKIYTVLEVLKLQESGKLQITDSVKDHLDFFPNKDITIEDLLSYRVNIPRDGNFNFWITELIPTEDEIISEIKNLDVRRVNEFKYSNLSYAIVGLILKKYGVVLNLPKLENIKGYGKQLLNGMKEYGYIDYKGFNESFGLYKDIVEITEFANRILIQDGNLLKPESWKTLLNVHLETNAEEDDVALALRKWKGENIFEIHGYSFGFVSSMLLDYDSGMAFTVLSNSSDEGFAGYFNRTIKRLVEYFQDKAQIDTTSKLNGFYRGKDDDIVVYDCTDSLYVFRPKHVTPFHQDNYEIFKKIGVNQYLLNNKPGDAYEDEVAFFEFDASGNTTGFRQGGWGFTKFSPDLG